MLDPERLSLAVGVPPNVRPLSRICVIFASRGRPSVLAAAVSALARQSLRPASIILSCPDRSDIGPLAQASGVSLVLGAVGLAAQRNAGLRHVPAGTDLVVFFDDDFVPEDLWLERVTAVFDRHADVGAVTGTLIADGIKGPGLNIAEARRLLAVAPSPKAAELQEPYIPYGCNMAFRASAIAGRCFDERLVLYGWLEDRDFGQTIAGDGFRIVKTPDARGVHLGIKAGRVSGRQLGYSQIINPLYLYRKGTMPFRAATDHMLRNLVSNLFRAFAPESFIDRRGRLMGNLRGMNDALRGILEPERAAEL